MSRPRTNWEAIAGTDDPNARYLLGHCERRGKIIPLPGVISEFLDQYEVIPDAAFPHARKHLSSRAVRFLGRCAEWRWGYKTHALPLPSLAYWCRRLHLSECHASALARFLAGQGLIRVWTGLKRGLKLGFAVDVLHEQVAAWLDARRGHLAEADAQAEPESAQPLFIQQDAPEAEAEPEAVLEPLAALQAAPEWDMALPGIKREVGEQVFLMHFWGIKACWQDGRLLILPRNRSQYDMLLGRFRRVLNRHLAGYNFAVAPEPARSSA